MSSPSSAYIQLELPMHESSQHTVLSADRPKSALVVAATGLGKTCVMASLAEHWPVGRVMMISHRYELNDQARHTFQEWCDEAVDFEQAEYVADQCSDEDRCRIIVASVQSLNSKRNGRYRFEKFDPNEFGLIMIDEAHRAVSPTYRRVINYFRQGNEDCRLVGVTATPDRLDGIGLGHVFEHVAADFNIRWGIEQGWLVPIRQHFVDVEGLDFSSIASRKNEVKESDFDRTQLAKILESESMLHEMASPIVELAGDRSTIVFAASVQQAERLAEIINRHKENSAHSIDGSLPPMHPQRRKKTAAFKTGEYQYLVNCGVATEGFDAWRAAVIAMCRPTKSRSLYTQCIGRGTRPVPDLLESASSAEERQSLIHGSTKPSCMVLDFLGQAGRHRLICTGDILAGENDPKPIIDAAKRIATKREFDGDMVAALQQARQEYAEREAARRAKLTAKVTYTTKEIDCWSPTSLAPPRYVRGFAGNAQPSVKMKATLKKFGLTNKEVESLNFAQARTTLNQIFKRIDKGLCSIKQRRLLSKFGVDAAHMTFAQASAEIDKLAKNGWRRPDSE